MAQLTKQLITTATLANANNKQKDFNKGIFEKKEEYDSKYGTIGEKGAFLGENNTVRSTEVECDTNKECKGNICNVMGGNHRLGGNHKLKRKHTNKYKSKKNKSKRINRRKPSKKSKRHLR